MQQHEVSVDSEEDEPPSLLEQWVQDPDMPNELRTQLQELLDHAAELPSTGTVRSQGFDTEMVSRFVFAGVVDRGWTPARFGEIDRHLAQNSGDSGRSAHKRERVAKKYQWQALHEAYARLADTHSLRNSSDLPYPLGIDIATDSVRDIDPTHLLTGNSEDEKTDDYETLAASFYPEPAGPDLTTWNTHTQWVADASAMIDTSELHVAEGRALTETSAGQALGVPVDSRWIVMTSTVAWNWDQFGRTPQLSQDLWADHGVVEHTLIIKAEDTELVLREAPDRYQPFAFRSEFFDGPFLGEVHGQSHYQALLRRRDLDGSDDDGFGISAPATATVDRYVWEGSILDCSLHSTVSVSFPSKELLDILAPGGTVRDGGTYASDGTLIAFSPGAYQTDDDIDLFIRADLMNKALRASGHKLVRVTFQERRGGADLHSHGRSAGMRTRTSVHVHEPADGGEWVLIGTAPHQDELVPPRTD